MSNSKQTNLDRITEVWRLHDCVDQSLATEGRCLAFVIDRRFIEDRGAEFRLAMSFGTPVVATETEQGFLPIPVQSGEFVFGLHEIGTKGNQLMIYDSWMDAVDAGGCTDPAQAEVKARAFLDAMSDEEYHSMVQASNVQGSLKVSSMHLLKDFEVLQGEAW